MAKQLVVNNCLKRVTKLVLKGLKNDKIDREIAPSVINDFIEKQYYSPAVDITIEFINDHKLSNGDLIAIFKQFEKKVTQNKLKLY